MVGSTDGGRHRRDRPSVGRLLAAIALRRGERLAGDPLTPDLTGDADHLGPNRGVLDACLGHYLSAGQVGAQGVAQLMSEQLDAQPALTRGAHPKVVEEFVEACDRFGGAHGRRLQPGQESGYARLMCRGFGLRHRVLDQGYDPGKLLYRRLRVQPRGRQVGQTPQLAPSRRKQGPDAFQPSSHRFQPRGQRGELACQQGEDAAAEQVDVAECVPGTLSQFRLVEAHRGKLGEEQVAIYPLVGGTAGVRHCPELRLPAIDEGKPGCAATFGQVRPLPVVGVIADGRRRHGIEAEELVQECVHSVREHDHVPLPPCSGSSVAKGWLGGAHEIPAASSRAR